MPRKSAIHVFLSLCLLALLSGCSTPVGTKSADFDQVAAQLHRNVMTQDRVSLQTWYLLQRLELVKPFAEAPAATLQSLLDLQRREPDRDLLFALAELHYLHANALKASRGQEQRQHFLAASLFAYEFLFGDTPQALPDGFDPRFRIACDLYNQALGRALAQRIAGEYTVDPSLPSASLPEGTLRLHWDTADYPWTLDAVDRLLLADQFTVKGLRVRNRVPGLGVPLVAVLRDDLGADIRSALATSLILLPEQHWLDRGPGEPQATLQLHSGYQDRPLAIAGRRVPLERDTTVAMAYALNQPRLWWLEYEQFFLARETVPTGVYLNQPYEPGKIPLVFVHGTASSPVRWSEMVNTLRADTELMRRYQMWFFVYNTGVPVAVSGQRLREALSAQVGKLDPEGRDPALRQMVVVGHSQGGLLTKMTATDTGDQLRQALLQGKKARRPLSPEEEALINRYTVLDPLPFVRRVVFISTPHRGSATSDSFFGSLMRRTVQLPGKIIHIRGEIVQLGEAYDLPEAVREGVPTSIDSMSPKNRWLTTFADIPLAPQIHGHSIIAIKDESAPPNGSDGLVTYSSAHLEGMDSEFIVRSGHSCQGRMATISEVRRILHEHLRTIGTPSHKEGTNDPH